jgi:hypothetical protein
MCGCAGEVPPKVSALVESLATGGLLRALEAVFSLELSSDRKYFSHYAAMEAALQGQCTQLLLLSSGFETTTATIVLCPVQHLVG